MRRRAWQAEATFVNGAKFTFGVHGSLPGALLKSYRLLAEMPVEADRLRLHRVYQKGQRLAEQADRLRAPSGVHVPSAALRSSQA